MSTPSIFDYLPESAEAIWKMAEDKDKPQEPIKNPIAHAVTTVGTGLAWMGMGTLAGYGAGALANAAVKAITGKDVSPGKLQIPAALAGAGLNYSYQRYKDKELEELRRAFKSYRDRPKRSVSGQ